MRSFRQAVIFPLIFAALQPIPRAEAQDVVAVPVGKEPPAQVPGGGIQVNVYNLTRQSLRLRLRNPGGNWQVFTFPPKGGLNLRCTTCSDHLESMLLNEGASLSELRPGTDYEIHYGDGTGRFLLRPKSTDGSPQGMIWLQWRFTRTGLPSTLSVY